MRIVTFAVSHIGDVNPFIGLDGVVAGLHDPGIPARHGDAVRAAVADADFESERPGLVGTAGGENVMAAREIGRADPAFDRECVAEFECAVVAVEDAQMTAGAIG